MPFAAGDLAAVTGAVVLAAAGAGMGQCAARTPPGASLTPP